MKNLKLLLIMFLLGVSTAVSTAAYAEELYKANVEASYYAEKYHGRKTANGEIFNMNALTAAHKTLPFGTVLKVTNLSNGNSVQVRINDRGPFVAGREIDLSKAAAIKLNMLKSGTAKVSLHIISIPEKKTVTKTTTKNIAAKPEAVQKFQFDEVKDLKWDIQLGAYSNQDYAKEFAQKLLRDGFRNVAYQKTSSITRVVIRDLATTEVQSILDLLEEKGYKDFLVKERTLQ